MNDVRDNIRAIVYDKGLKQTIVAKKANLTSAKLSGIIHKTRKLEANELFEICNALEMTPEELKNYDQVV